MASMADTCLTLVVIPILLNSVITYKIKDEQMGLLTDIIKSKKLRQEGYHDFELSTFHEVDFTTGSLNRASSDSIRRRRSAEGSRDDPLNFTFNAFHRDFNLRLTYNTQLLQPGLLVTTVDRERRSTWAGQPPDCFLTGWTEARGVASLTYCDGISGSVAEGDTLYRIDPVGEVGEHFKETVLVSKTTLSAANRDHLYNITGKMVQSYNKTDQELGQDGGSTDQRRRKRQTYPTITVEVGIYLDEVFTALLEVGGATTDESKILRVATRWNMVQAMHALPDELQYEVVIQIKGIEFWATNPAWFNFAIDNIDSSLDSFCSGIRAQGTTLAFDHMHIHTGVETSSQGLAFTPGVCVTNRCGLSSDKSFYNGFITAHELGHALGMVHDDAPGVTCPDGEPCVGFMMTSGYSRYGWSTISRKALDNFVKNQAQASCLDTVNVDPGSVPPAVAAVSLDGLWPGMLYSNDELCEQMYGAGYQRREFYYAADPCHEYSCVNLNEGPGYGTMAAVSQPIYGEYCAAGKVCNRKTTSCVPYADTGVPASKITVRAGGWSAWGATSSCSRTCGTGLMVKTRTCTNPRPLNSAACEGPAYQGEVCDTGGCTSNPGRTTRAGEVCQRLLDAAILSSSKYKATGDRMRSDTSFGQCEVKCNPVSGYTSPWNFRFAFMPDGTSCNSAAVVKTTAELNGYPRVRGLQALCMRGSCEVFGCNGLAGTVVLDGCRVCGGDASTCQSFDKLYCEDLQAGARITLVTIPAGATDLQFYFNFNDMDEYYVELYDQSGAIIATMVEWTFSTGDFPRAGAGSLWNFEYHIQHLWSTGPTTEEIIIKFHSVNGGTNTCVHLGFSLPLVAPPPTFAVTVTDDPDAAINTGTTTAATTTSTTTTAATTTNTTTTAAPTTSTTTAAATTTSTTTTGAPTTSTATTAAPTTSTTTTAAPTTSTTTNAATTTSTTTTAAPTTSTTATAAPTTSTTTTAAPTTSTTTTVGTITGGTTKGGSGTGATCGAGMFRCSTVDACFWYEELCDGVDNCGDNSDEDNILCVSAAAAVTTDLATLFITTLLSWMWMCFTVL